VSEPDFLVTSPDDNVTIETIEVYGNEKIKKDEAMLILNSRAERLNPMTVDFER
jgi:hypothetical protein